jgi:CubicO group peptidase (beta-lactamase class C family)
VPVEATAVTPLMRDFPPAPDGQVTLANWRTAPFNQWAFHHAREIVPSADIPNDPAHVMALPSDPVDMDAVRIDAGADGTMSFDRFFEETHTDGIAILHRGRIAVERYAGGTTADTPHILMSVSKSLLGLLAGVLTARGALDPERPVTDWVPEVAATAYRTASIRHLLDMRAGVAFDEDYLATTGPILAYRKAGGWNPVGPGEQASDLRSFYGEMRESQGRHGGPFNYVSPNTDLLAWAIERAAGRRYADLMSDLIWKPLGAERSAYITVDRLGAPRGAGGMCATVRDLARVGQMIAQGGASGAVQVVPAAWIDDITRNGDAEAWAAGNFADYFTGDAMRYRSQWYVLDGKAPMLFGVGIHGQNLFVDTANEIVIAKVSSQSLPLDAARITLTRHAVAAVRSFLAGIPAR